jgi:hypothetical protein
MRKRTTFLALLFLLLIFAVYSASPSGRLWIKNLGQERTEYNFIYAYDWEWNNTGNSPYKIEGNKILYTSSSTPNPYLFNVAKEVGKSIPVDAIQSLRISEDLVSPDGFVFIREYLPCDQNGQCPHIYLRNVASGNQREIDLPPIEFIGGPHFVGWIIP